jgi:hypothetical protein
MKDDEGTVLLEITLTSNRDREPLQMISGEQKAKWQAIERVARRLVYNKHIACGTLRPILDALEVTLVMPPYEGE